MSGGLVILMGLRGSGKSSVGPALARAIGKPFVDLDDLLAQQAGAPSAAALWADIGQAGFREREAEALRHLLDGPACVLALGGGTPTAPGAAEALRTARETAGTIVVYLRADAALLHARLSRTDMAARPSITGADPLAEIAGVLAARDPLYLSLADMVIGCGAEGPEEVAGEIARRITNPRPA